MFATLYDWRGRSASWEDWSCYSRNRLIRSFCFTQGMMEGTF